MESPVAHHWGRVARCRRRRRLEKPTAEWLPEDRGCRPGLRVRRGHTGLSDWPGRRRRRVGTRGPGGSRGRRRKTVSESTRDPPPRRVVRGDLEAHAIALGDPDVVNVQAAAALGENGSAMSSGKIFDGIEAASTALRDDTLQNEKVPFVRGYAVRHSLPRFVRDIVGVMESREVESAFEPS